MQKNSIKAILFDMDGVLVDARQWHWLSFNQALSLFGFGMTEREHESRFDGLPTHTKLEMLADEGKVPKGVIPLVRKMKSEYTKRLIDLNCKPDYAKLIMLKELKSMRLNLVCCSNATTESVNTMLGRSGLLEYFDLVYGNTSGFKPKPSPEIYNAAIEHLGLSKDEVIIIEDSPHGIEAAKASGAKHVIEVDGYQDVNTVLILDYLRNNKLNA